MRLQAQIKRNILIVHGQGDRGERKGEISERSRNRCGGREQYEREFEWPPMKVYSTKTLRFQRDCKNYQYESGGSVQVFSKDTITL